MRIAQLGCGDDPLEPQALPVNYMPERRFVCFFSHNAEHVFCCQCQVLVIRIPITPPAPSRPACTISATMQGHDRLLSSLIFYQMSLHEQKLGLYSEYCLYCEFSEGESLNMCLVQSLVMR
jgi:hypothetical protein